MPASPLSETELEAWRALLRAHAALLDVLERELVKEHAMPLAFYEVLANLSEAGGRMRMSDLAGRVMLSRSGLTRLIDRMGDAGYVAREACPSDRRGALAVLTPAGKAALDAAWPSHARGVAEHFAQHFSPEEAEQLGALLTRITTALPAAETITCDGAA